MRKHHRLLALLTGICMTGALPAGVVQAEPLPPSQFDFNADGSVDTADAVSLVKYLHGISRPENIRLADLDSDGTVDVFDLGLFLRLLVQECGLDMEELKAQCLSADYTGAEIEAVEADAGLILGQTEFALDLLQNTAEPGKNVLVSPYSVSQALGMTANGARGETLSEMEDVLGGTIDDLNAAFYTFRTSAPQTENARLSTANSIWVRRGYPVRGDFLQTNADYYAAEAYSAPFDTTTLNDINNWVDTRTEHMVPSILDEIDDNAMLYLVNAVAFDAGWAEPYEKNQIETSVFTAADGTKQEAQMMRRTLHSYLEDDHAAGFMQSYQGGEYAFAALLPEKGMTPEEYIDGLTAEDLHKMLAKPQETPVVTGLPEFSYDYDTLLNGALISMGMPSAFSSGADFSGMTENEKELSISRVIHKTHIELTPVGTRAGAATVVEMRKNGGEFYENAREVILDRPFVYMIVDMRTSLPVFIGTVNSIS